MYQRHSIFGQSVRSPRCKRAGHNVFKTKRKSFTSRPVLGSERQFILLVGKNIVTDR